MMDLGRACVTVTVLAALVAGWPAGQPAAHGDAMQHVWVHYDYMVMPDGRSLAPDPRSLQLVVDAFAAHGIALHIDPQHTVIPYYRVIVAPASDLNSCVRLGFGPSDFVELDALKAQYFHPTANHDWHYAVFGDLSGCNGQSGVADSPDFVVSLGKLRRLGLSITPYVEGGTFMHELGHALGLQHPSPNWSSNDLSVMNYRFQFGIPYTATPGSVSIVGLKLDYAEEALPRLNESHLDETAGVGATLPSDRTDVTSWTNPTAGPFALSGPASGPVDWNHDGKFESDVAVDLDNGFNVLECGFEDVNPMCPGMQLFENQTAIDEWAEVHQWIAGNRNPGPKTFEHEDAASEPVISIVTPASGPEAGGNSVTVRGAHFEKVTQVSFGDELASSFTVLTDDTLMAVAPPGEGTVEVTVVAGDNTSPNVSSDLYTYLAPPSVDSISPSSGVTGTVVTIRGSNFTGATAVHFGAAAATSVTVIDDQTISSVVPAQMGSPSVSVSVTGPGGTSSASALDQFTYVPAITSVSPTAGLPGAVVTIHGTSFSGATRVAFGGTYADSWTVVDDETIAVVVPLSPLEGSTVDVTVTTPGGTSPPAAGDRFTLE